MRNALSTRIYKWNQASWKGRFGLLYMSIWVRLSILGGLILVVLLHIIRPLISIRIGLLVCARIGHLATNTEVWMRDMAVRGPRPRTVNIFLSDVPANKQLLKMIGRRIKIIENQSLYLFAQNVCSLTPNNKLWINLRSSGYGHWNVWNSVGPQLSFTDEENKQGADVLRSIGIADNKSFVCFCVRDSAYLDVAGTFRTRAEWSYHDHRDNDIQNYIPSARYIADKGLSVLRMGAVVQDPLRESRAGLIDYATKFRSDFGDIFLLANCKFFLGDTAGIFGVSAIFDVPCALANIVPYRSAERGLQDLFIPKKLWYVDEKRFLTLSEIISTGIDLWGKKDQYTKAGIEVIENTAEEVLALTQEMHARLDGNWVSYDDEEELQQRYRDSFPADHPVTGYPSRVGTEFLRNNLWLLS